MSKDVKIQNFNNLSNPSDEQRSHMESVASGNLPTAQLKTGIDLLNNRTGFVVGAREGALMRLPVESHLVTMGKTGSGKGRAAQIPNFNLHEGSLLSVEIGGAGYKHSHNYRRTFLGQDVYLIDPFDCLGEGSSSFNVLDTLDASRKSFETDVGAIAESILQSWRGTTNENPYWENVPKALLEAIIIYVKTSPDIDDKDRHLPEVSRRFNSFGQAEWNKMMEEMSADTGPFHSILNASANYYYNSNSTENVRSIVSSIKDGPLRKFNIRAIADITKTSSFDVKDLRDKKTSVYVVMPDASSFRENDAFLRLLIDGCFKGSPNLADGGLKYKDDRILFMIDEFTQLGKLESIDVNMQTARQKGITVWTLFQDYSRLKEVYGNNIASSIMGAADVVQVFAAHEESTLDYLSKQIGDRMYAIPTVQHSRSWSDTNGKTVTEAVSVSKGYSDTTGSSETNTITWQDTDTVTDTTGSTTSDSETKGENVGTSSSDSDGWQNSTSKGTDKGKQYDRNHGMLAEFAFKTTFDRRGASSKGEREDRSFGRNGSTTKSSSHGTQSSQTTSRADQVSKAVGQSSSKGGSTSKTSNESHTKNHGEQTTKGTGSNSSHQEGGQHSISYTYTKMPAVSPAQLSDMLGTDNQQVLIIQKGGRRVLLDFLANWDENPGLVNCVYGPGDEVAAPVDVLEELMPGVGVPDAVLQYREISEAGLQNPQLPSSFPNTINPKLPVFKQDDDLAQTALELRRMINEEAKNTADAYDALMKKVKNESYSTLRANEDKLHSVMTEIYDIWTLIMSEYEALYKFQKELNQYEQFVTDDVEEAQSLYNQQEAYCHDLDQLKVLSQSLT